MGKLEWHNGLNLGVSEIDDQHKALISAVNSVLESVRQGKSDAAVDRLLGQLREYSVHHFNSEEQFMTEIDYPDLNRHRQIHKQFKDRVKFYQAARFRKEHVSWGEMQEFISNWLIEHILREDYKIAQFVKSRGGK
ncbi:bacteriohemerythrin [Maridesulfovibrio sp.]|uniref:bacteriohemerythrin n=1 Tax=Maridesulfovibrio sp. TaxID=2795000 RepID=UPI002A18D30B|nr:bacteriohemerythrin [Maridesulfovibrio sp.]